MAALGEVNGPSSSVSSLHKNRNIYFGLLQTRYTEGDALDTFCLKEQIRNSASSYRSDGN